MAKEKSGALREAVERVEGRAVEIAREYSEIGERIQSLRAERSRLSDEWDSILQRDGELCEEINDITA